MGQVGAMGDDQGKEDGKKGYWQKDKIEKREMGEKTDKKSE
jgi:hypothetical protein